MDYYVPKQELAVASLIDQVADDAIPNTFSNKEEYGDFVDAILELESIRVETELTQFQTLELLVSQMFNEEIVLPEDIDVIVLAEERNGNPEYNLAQELQHRFKMKNAFVFNISGNHCANLEVAITTISKIQNKEINNVLILNSTLIGEAKDRIIGSYGLIGDAAGIMLLGSDNNNLNILHSSVQNNGLMHKGDTQNENNLIHSKYILKCVKEVLQQGNYALENIEKLIIQNANPLLYSHILTNAGLDTDKIYNANFGKYGHLDCLDFLVNLNDASKSESLKKDDLILSVGMGWAGCYVAILFSMN